MPLKYAITQHEIAENYLKGVEISSELFERLEELEERLHQQKSNPAVVGLAGFAVTTIVFQIHNFGLIENTPALALGLFVGGLAQFIAGLHEHHSGDNLAYSAFTTFGGFWMALASLLFAAKQGWIDLHHKDLGCYLVAFTFYGVICLGAAVRTNVGLTLTFGTLVIGFIFLDIGILIGEKAGDPLHITGGVFLLLSAAFAWYVMAHLMYKSVYGRDILPVGPPPLNLKQHKNFDKRKMQSLRRPEPKKQP